MTQLVLGVPSSVLNVVQQGLMERAFHDGLYPQLLYRSEAVQEEWEANTGTEIFMTRPGLLPAITKPLQPGTDPQPQTVSYEQWVARLARYAGTIDTHMPTAAVANVNLFLRNIHQLGLQAGMSLNRIPRNILHREYLSGHTNLIAATAAADTAIRVASVNGFTDVVVKGTNVRPSLVSSNTPLSITIQSGATAITRNVIGYDLDNPDDPFGPGTLMLSAAVGAIVAVRAPVLSSARPKIIRSGGGLSVDALGMSDVFQLQDAIAATSYLRKNNVPPHEDGTYHAHISTDGNAQIFTDPIIQRLNTSMPDGVFQDAFIGSIAGLSFFLNNETPDASNSGPRTTTGTMAAYSEDIGAETTNESGVGIGRILVTGRGALVEKYLDESNYVTEAGITGKVGDFQVVNAGLEVQTEHVRLILRAPLNRLQDIVSSSWSITTAFAVPSDVVSGGPERFKRAVIIEHALSG